MDRSHFSYLFFALEGRIPRKAYWIGTLAIIALSIGVHVVLGLLLGLSLEDLEKSGPMAGWISIGVTLLFAYPGIAVMVKRLHDRDRSGWWAVLLYALTFLGDLMEVAGLAGTEKNPSMLFWIWAVPFIVLALAFLIDLGFMRGTVGDNRYGPDPLGGTPDAKLD